MRIVLLLRESQEIYMMATKCGHQSTDSLKNQATVLGSTLASKQQPVPMVQLLVRLDIACHLSRTSMHQDPRVALPVKEGLDGKGLSAHVPS